MKFDEKTVTYQPNNPSKPVIINTEKIKFFLPIESDPRKVVNLVSCSFLIEILSEGVKLKKVGSKVKVIINEVIKPKVIIHPKSIIGLISLKIKDKPQGCNNKY